MESITYKGYKMLIDYDDADDQDEDSYYCDCCGRDY